MCLVLLRHDPRSPHPLVLAANRDELHARPAQPFHRWPDLPHVWAGRDLQAGGTWLGLSSRGRLAAVTNLRGGPATAPRSRGALVTDFLDGTTPAADFVAAIRPEAYRPFNLLVWDGEVLAYASSDAPARVLPPGLHGVSNASMGAPWPKVTGGVDDLDRAVRAGAATDDLLALLADDRPPPDGSPGTEGLDPVLARAVAARFVRHPVYGTRASTVVRVDGRGARVTERAFGPAGRPGDTVEATVPWDLPLRA
ncbi:MAG: NRDE family protein [Alphaproteobacteria bacterium]|nr:NRDE family protein [Alphaproteobacteria bacterium]